MGTDFEHCKILSKHACCNNLNGYTHLEYYKEADVKGFIKEILNLVPDHSVFLGKDENGKKRYSTMHKEIKKYAGNKLSSPKAC